MIRGSSAEACWPGWLVAFMTGCRSGDGGPTHGGCRRSIARRMDLLEVADAAGRGLGGVVGEVEVLAQGEARVVGRHVDAAQVAVALERDPEHVVGLALLPLGALPEEGHGWDPRVIPGEAIDDDP